ncbi:DUF305 domain-containing protein [Streptomyces sp. NPDC006678]|uniref:DUF305 domain-containing protein n=1 Tax=Streptomyces sp. NPDC006678 TaxID=3157185 RepID=UPI0033EA3E79
MTAFKHAPLSCRARLRPPHRRMVVTAAVAAGALLLAGCGGDGTTDSRAAAPKATAPTAVGAFNDADVAFAQGMIPHHQQALEVAGLAAGRASDQEIRTLARAVEKAQDPEIRTMRSWLGAWGEPESSGTEHGNHGGGGTAGMMSEQDMKDLTAAKGRDFDRAFAQMMIDHHNGAIEMARTEQADGRNADARKLAGAVVKAQSAEVEQLRSILDRL